MSTTSRDLTTDHPRRELGWRKVRQRLAEWRHRARARHELSKLSDRTLQDIGVSRAAADFDASKPFWMV
jgi:uncharacterized protein YjiS (DUF1127 family)